MGVVDVYKQYGVRSAAVNAVYRTLRRTFVFDVSHLMLVDLKDVPLPNESLAIFRALTIQDVKRFAADGISGLNESDADRLLDNLDYCIGALVDDQLVGYFWLGLDSIEAVHNRGEKPGSGVALSFPESTVFAYNAFVTPDRRDSGIYMQLVRAACHFARDVLGVRYLASTIECTNIPELNSFSNHGISSIGRIWRFGVGGALFTKAPKMAKRHGIRIGKTAHVRVRGAE